MLVLAVSLSASAQNIIVTNEGDAIKAYNIEMTGNSVFYQTSPDDNASIKKLSKTDILIIKMQDGTKLDPNEPEKPAEAPASVSGSIVRISGETAQRNAAMIADFNKELVWEPDEKFFRKGQGKVGNGYTGIMWVKEDSQLYNGEVTISYQRFYEFGSSSSSGNTLEDYRYNNFVNPMVVVKVKNNTDRIIFLDLGSSFVISGEDSTPYFVPEITTVSNTNTSKRTSEYAETKVGEDNIKSSDHSYVSGNTQSVTKVKEAQRYVSVAPKATLSLEPQKVCSSENGRYSQMYNHLGYLYMNKNVFPFGETHYGDILELDEANSPYNFGSCVSYSFNADHSDIHTIRTEMYMKYIMCTSSTALFAYTIDADIHRRYPFWVSFYVTDSRFF